MKGLSHYTPARVELGSAGGSLPTKPLLEFRMAHAKARDAVHHPLDTFNVCREFAGRKWPLKVLHSEAKDRNEYLRRPDKGRKLNEQSAMQVAALGLPAPPSLLFVVADGLSTVAVHRHAVPLLENCFRSLSFEPSGSNPIFVVEQARVAIGDHLGDLLRAEMSVVLIGERPGLTTPDSLSIYFTWRPGQGRTDAERNCISNIHDLGLSYELAAHKLAFLINESRRLRLSGVALKESAGRLLDKSRLPLFLNL